LLLPGLLHWIWIGWNRLASDAMVHGISAGFLISLLLRFAFPNIVFLIYTALMLFFPGSSGHFA